MELITTHIGADFDALASVIAARKLYPDAMAVLPGSPEKAVRDFLSLWQDELGLDCEKDIDLGSVTKLIIVETRVASRIGRAEELLGKKELCIEVYDHHPRTRFDIKADKDIYKQTGATVTILLDIFKKKASLSPLEATVMALGIYEDTGSLTFQTTTKLDIDMVGYLFSQGASLNTVSRYLKKELTHKQLKFLSELIKNTRDYIINGTHIGIAFIKSGEYIEDFSLLVHKLIDIENFNVLFAFTGSDSNLLMVARSNLPFVAVDKIAERFGGGGHLYAASAKIKDMKLAPCIKKLLDLLKLKIRPEVFAEDILSKAVVKIPSSKSVKDAKDLMYERGCEVLVVYDESRVAGIITLPDTERAIKKGYGHSKVKGYVTTKFTKITPRTPLIDIHDIITREHIRYLPVFKKKKLIGMISRSDIAKAVYKDLTKKRPVKSKKKPFKPPVKNILTRMNKGLPKSMLDILKLAGSLANRRGYRIFAVGGFVRDILLGAKNLDIDIVLEGDGLKFARELATLLKGSLIVHKRFGTASIVAGPNKIDIATARTEYYEYPAALPNVRFGSIKQDLYRRDFTINAMAVSLNKKSFGELIDFFHGQRDLNAGIIRILHNLSFVEDPTRIFRAVRFEQRYNFTIDKHTKKLIKTAISLDMFSRTQKQRLRDELIFILSEKKPARALSRMHQLHELRFIHPKLKFCGRMLNIFSEIEETLKWYHLNLSSERGLDEWLIYLFAMLNNISLTEQKKLSEKFVFKKSDEKRLISCKKNAKKVSEMLKKPTKVSPNRIYRSLEPLSYEVILFIMAAAKTQRSRERVALFFKKYNNVKLLISGRDLKALGIKPGPEYRRILNRVLYAKLDGKLSCKKDELFFARNLSRGVICPG
jgi:tRNA nucleotidyltransferase (CCA-adding enzyme)